MVEAPRVNLNTIVGVGGFCLTLATVVFLSGQNSAKIDAQNAAVAAQLAEFQKRQEQYNATLDSDRRAARVAYDTKMEIFSQSLVKVTTVLEQHSTSIASLQKKDDEADARVNRIAESAGDKFTEINAALGTINTQLALLAQTVTEIKQVISPQADIPVPHPKTRY